MSVSLRSQSDGQESYRCELEVTKQAREAAKEMGIELIEFADLQQRVKGARADGTAKTLKAILYAEGCQFSVLSVDLLADPIRNETFQCVPLSKITLRGIISPPPSATGALDVEIYYVAAWDHKFFHLADA